MICPSNPLTEWLDLINKNYDQGKPQQATAEPVQEPVISKASGGCASPHNETAPHGVEHSVFRSLLLFALGRKKAGKSLPSFC